MKYRIESSKPSNGNSRGFAAVCRQIAAEATLPPSLPPAPIAPKNRGGPPRKSEESVEAAARPNLARMEDSTLTAKPVFNLSDDDKPLAGSGKSVFFPSVPELKEEMASVEPGTSPRPEGNDVESAAYSVWQPGGYRD